MICQEIPSGLFGDAPVLVVGAGPAGIVTALELRRHGIAVTMLAGGMDGFHYSPNFAKADFTWDDARLDAWMTNPQQMVPGAVMAYRQAKPEVRAAIIAYLKELH